jgi:hypothetical protein
MKLSGHLHAFEAVLPGKPILAPIVRRVGVAQSGSEILINDKSR